MNRCGFSPRAESDLRQIHDFIAPDNPSSALRLIERIEEVCNRLAEHPSLGVARPELSPEARSFAVPGTRYLIFYQANENGIQVLHVRHGSRGLVRWFE